MRIQIKGEATIQAPASKVWHILAHEFADIGQWASVIPKSKAVTHLPTPTEAPVAGRVCANSVPGFSHIQEEFTYYDEEKMRFGYIATQGMPSFVKRAENNWAVKPIVADQCQVEIRGYVTLPSVLGFFLAPLMKLQFSHLGAKTMAELKYYVEHDQPHPRKVKAQRKQQRMLTGS